MLLSGGVDSTVCAALLHKALAEEQVIAIHVDNGFMRKDESAMVETHLNELGLHVKGMSACAHFLPSGNVLQVNQWLDSLSTWQGLLLSFHARSSDHILITYFRLYAQICTPSPPDLEEAPIHAISVPNCRFGKIFSDNHCV